MQVTALSVNGKMVTYFGPIFTQVHPFATRKALSAVEVNTCLTTWAVAIRSVIHLPDDAFSNIVASNDSLKKFLHSYIINDKLEEKQDWLYTATRQESRYIKRSIFRCFVRSVELGLVKSLLEPHAFIKLASLFLVEGARSLFTEIWDKYTQWARKATRDHLRVLSSMLGDVASGEKMVQQEHIELLQELSYFIAVLPEISDEVLLNEPFFDSLGFAHSAFQPSEYNQLHVNCLVETWRVLFMGILAGFGTKQRRYTPTMDFLFSLLTDIEQNNTEAQNTQQNIKSQYLTAVVAGTPLLEKLDRMNLEGYQNRLMIILQKLRNLPNSRENMNHFRFSDLPRRKIKLRNSPSPREGSGTINMNSTGLDLLGSSIGDLVELFPQLDLVLLQQVLEAHQGNVESATFAILENLKDTKTTTAPEQAYIADKYRAQVSAPVVHPHGEVDHPGIPRNKIYLGKRQLNPSADILLATRSGAPSKAKILAALQTFDSDEDERDDTYDVDDVGGAVSTSLADNESSAINTMEIADDEKLYKALVETPSIYARDARTRRSVGRQELRETTGLTDEAIEGWKIMLDRDGGKRLRQLEIKFARGSGGHQSRVLQSANRGLIPQEAENQSADLDIQDEKAILSTSASSLYPGDPHNSSGTIRHKRTSQPHNINNQRAQRDKHDRKSQRAKKIAKAGFRIND